MSDTNDELLESEELPELAEPDGRKVWNLLTRFILVVLLGVVVAGASFYVLRKLGY